MDYCLQLFLLFIKTKNYQDAINLFSHIETINSKTYQNDNMLYLYLLNMLTDCNETYRKILEKFNPDELLESINQSNIKKEDYEIIRNISINKFRHAFKLLNNKIQSKDGYSIKDEVLRELLSQTVDKEEYYKYNLSSLVRKNKLEEIISLLEEKRKQRYLNNNETYIYLITKSLIEITKTRIIPVPQIASTTYLYDAIKGNNFALAKTLNIDFLQRVDKNPEEDLVNILLTRINDLILEIKLEDIPEINESLEKDTDIKPALTITEDSILDKENITSSQENKEPEETNELSFAQDLAYYIQSQNLTIESARKQLGIIPSQVLLIKLIYARDYYIEEMYALGDKLVKEVEKSKDKTKEVKRFLNEVRTEKKFYKNRLDIHTRRKVNIPQNK